MWHRAHFETIRIGSEFDKGTEARYQSRSAGVATTSQRGVPSGEGRVMSTTMLEGASSRSRPKPSSIRQTVVPEPLQSGLGCETFDFLYFFSWCTALVFRVKIRKECFERASDFDRRPNILSRSLFPTNPNSLSTAGSTAERLTQVSPSSLCSRSTKRPFDAANLAITSADCDTSIQLPLCVE